MYDSAGISHSAVPGTAPGWECRLLYTLGPSPIRTHYHIPVDEAYVLTLRRRLVELASAAVDSAQPRKIEWDKAPARLVGALITSYLTMKGVTLVMAR
jgi:hypothetical protein